MVEVFRNKLFLLVISLINFAAGMYSFSYYSSQLSATDPLLWIFVADCPLYAIIFGLVLISFIFDFPSRTLAFISIVGNVKYAFWTIFVLLISNTFTVNALVIASHSLLLVESIILLGLFAYRVKHVLLAIVWFIINDYFDYVIGTHPYVPEGFLIAAGVFALVSTLLLPFVISIVFSSKDDFVPKIVKKRGGKWGVRG